MNIYKNLCVKLYLAILILAIGFPAFAAELEWRSDYLKAREEAAQKNLPILIDFYTDNCFWCKQLDHRTFRDPALVQKMNEQWVVLKINARKETVLTEALKIRTFPTLVFAGPQGNILGFLEGFIEAPALAEQLNLYRDSSATPDWMNTLYQEATLAIASDDYPKAVVALKKIIEDGKQRPIQRKSTTLIEDFEKQAAERIAKAKKNLEQGNTPESIQLFKEVSRQFEGTNGAKESEKILATLANRKTNTQTISSPNSLAKDSLSLLKQDHQNANYLSCLDRYDYLASTFPESMETQEAANLIAEIKSNPEWMKSVCDQMSDRLANLYISLADSWAKKGHPQQAIYYLERTIQTFPGTKYSEAAQIRLAQLRGPSIRAVDLKK